MEALKEQFDSLDLVADNACSYSHYNETALFYTCSHCNKCLARSSECLAEVKYGDIDYLMYRKTEAQSNPRETGDSRALACPNCKRKVGLEFNFCEDPNALGKHLLFNYRVVSPVD
jgi:hypothetical protein